MESPVLFNIYMDFVVRIARQEVLKERPDAGMKVEYCSPNEVSPREYRSEAPAHGTTRITELLYADDEAIFGNSIEELKIILEIYDRTFARFGLKMSYSKTETMAFNVDEEIKEPRKSDYHWKGWATTNSSYVQFASTGYFTLSVEK